MTTTTEHAKELAHARRQLIDERYGDAVATIDRLLRDDPEPRERVQALTLRLIGLTRVGRTAELTPAIEEAFDAHKVAPDLSVFGELNALAALAAFRMGSLDRCATHLVRGNRALSSIELTSTTTAWAWHDLALAYSHTGFHSHALAAADHARQVATSVGLRPADFAAPGIRLRLAVALDHRGDTDGCQRVLRDIVADLEHRREADELTGGRPSNLGAYGYALARLATFGDRGEVAEAEVRSLLDLAVETGPGQDLRTLGLVCLAIAQRRPVEAVARLEAGKVSDETLGAAEPYRLLALAHLAAGDHASAHRADRHAFQVSSAPFERLRELFIETIAARLDSEELRRSVAGYAEGRHTDPLTGLPDRDQLERHLGEILARGEPLLVGMCDLERFTTVNTHHGRSSGDLVLQRVAGVLNRVMRRGDFVARAGGDEFAVVLPAAARPEINEITRRIATAIVEEDWDALVPGARVAVTIGWAGPDNGPFESAGAALTAASGAVAAIKATRRP